MTARPGVILAAFIAVAAAAGIFVSLVQKPPPSHPVPHITPASVGPTPVPRQPSVAFAFSVADDASTGQVVLFGGVSNFGNTWAWNGATWSLLHPANSPSGRYDSSAAFDPQSGQILLFGGHLESGTAVNDTWGWDGTNWQELSTGGSGEPAPGGGSQMAWDPALNQMLLVTPDGDSSTAAQTWIWTGTHWLQQRDAVLGAIDSSIILAYDPVSRTMLAEGCCEEQAANLVNEPASTWRWNGSTWSLVTGADSPSDASAIALDPVLGTLVLCNCNLVGGVVPSLWSWNGQQWIPRATDRVPSQPQAEVDDVAHSQMLLLGFAVAGAESIAQPVQTWALSGSVWRLLDAGPVSP
jgi:hypothetical protein